MCIIARVNSMTPSFPVAFFVCVRCVDSHKSIDRLLFVA